MRIEGLLSCVLLGCGASLGTTADPCAGEKCSNHGTCAVVSGVASCNCTTGYVKASYDPLACEPDRNTTGCGGFCCQGGQQNYCNTAPCGTTANKRDCCTLVGGDFVCPNP